MLTIFKSSMSEIWIIPAILFLASMWSLYRNYKASKSGSYVSGPMGESIPSDKNVPIYKVPGFVFTVGLFIASVGSLLWMLSER